MAHRHQNFWQPVRRYLWPKLHRALSLIGLFSLATTSDSQYVCTLPHSETEAERILAHELRFSWNPVAALKRNDERVSVGSWVYRDADDPRYWHDRRKKLPECVPCKQLHVTLFGNEGETDVYSHFEANYLRHPVQHVRGHELSEKIGVELTKELFDNHGINY